MTTMSDNLEIKHITHKQEWESGLSRYSYTTMFLAWEWGEFEISRGNDFEFYGVYENQRLVGLIPIKTVNAKRGKYLHVRHGPVIYWENEAVVKTVIDFLKQKAKEKGVQFVRISPLVSKGDRRKMKKLGFKNATSHANDDELTVIIDLRKNINEILTGMRKNTRNLIRRADKEGIFIKYCHDLSFFDDFAKVYLDTVNRKQWTAYPIEYIKAEYAAFARIGNARIFVAYYKGQPISASIFIIHRNQVIYHYSGSAKRFKNLPSTYLLHWEAIKYFKDLGLIIYNFWGVCREGQRSHPWYGLSLFKRGFSNIQLEFLHAQDLVLHPFAHITRLYEWFEAKWRGYS